MNKMAQYIGYFFHKKWSATEIGDFPPVYIQAFFQYNTVIIAQLGFLYRILIITSFATANEQTKMLKVYRTVKKAIMQVNSEHQDYHEIWNMASPSFIHTIDVYNSARAG